MKTRVFVTNTLNILSQTDRILLLEDGQIVENDSYSKLNFMKNSLFEIFIKNYLESIELQQKQSN